MVGWVGAEAKARREAGACCWGGQRPNFGPQGPKPGATKGNKRAGSQVDRIDNEIT